MKLYVVGVVSTNISTSFDDQKVKYKLNCYIQYTVLFVIILLFVIATNCYHYAKHRSKLKKESIALLKV